MGPIAAKPTKSWGPAMWFDAKAKLSEIEGRVPAKPATSATKPQETVTSCSSVADVATPSRAYLDALTRRDPSYAASRRNPALPAKSQTCDFCGQSDWQVAVTLANGRTLHVWCARSEGELTPGP